jgi:hypothetical protein
MGFEGWTKVPYQPNGQPARVNDPSTWCTYEAALAGRRSGEADGVALMLLDANIGIIDLDNSYDIGTKVTASWAQEIVGRAPKGAYVEPSVSGTGLHIVGKAHGPKLDTNTAMPDGGKLELFRNTPRAIVFSFLPIQGAGNELVNLDPLLDELALEFMRRKATVQAERGRTREGHWARGAMHEDLFKVIAKGVSIGDRSDKFYNVVAWLKQLDWVVDSIVWLFEQHPNGIAAKYAGRLRAEVQRAFDKVELTGVGYGDFFSYAPMHNYLYAPADRPWPGSSVDARLPRTALLRKDGKRLKTAVSGKGKNAKEATVTVPATFWFDKNRSVEEMTWAPGLPLLVHDRLMVEHGWIEKPGVTTYNRYIPPIEQTGDPRKALPWVRLVYKLYPDEARRFVQWFAHRVQKPQEKPNFGIVMGGEPGIGKDTILEGVRRAVGPWNFQDVAPHEMLGTFNPYNRAVILRVNESRDLGEMSMFAFHDRMKPYLASPPEGLPTNEKHTKRYTVANVCGVAYTTNYKENCLYLPANDRRHYVGWSGRTQADFRAGFWDEFWGWYHREGFGHVGAFLRALDISEFKAQEPPPKTAAFWAIVNANRAVEETELNDGFDEMGRPAAVTLTQVIAQAGLGSELGTWLQDRKNRRVVPKHLRAAGYEVVANPDADDGQWVVGKKRQNVYARADLSLSERITAVRRLTGGKGV